MAKAYGKAMTLLGKDFQSLEFRAYYPEKPKTLGTRGRDHNKPAPPGVIKSIWQTR
jgi:hypothetical protein